VRTPPKTRSVLVLAVLGAAACIALLLFSSPEFVRAIVIAPTSAVLRVLRRVAAAVGQVGLWAVLVVAFAVAAVTTLKGSWRRRPTGARAAAPLAAEPSFWESRLRHVLRSSSARESLVAELRKLVLTVLAFLEGTGADEIEERIRRGEVELPESVAAIVAVGPVYRPPLRSFLARMWRPVDKGQAEELQALLARTADVVAYLEKLLGTGGDRDNR
jgi:hypothetical protein